MRHLLMRVALVVTAVTIISPVQAQTASLVPAPPQRPPAAYSGSSFPYPFPAPTRRSREGILLRPMLTALLSYLGGQNAVTPISAGATLALPRHSHPSS